jgi:hypothetical protein
VHDLVSDGVYKLHVFIYDLTREPVFAYVVGQSPTECVRLLFKP